MALAIWAEAPDTPGNVCRDARLSGGDSGSYPSGTTRGQAGWDLGLKFKDLADLASQLSYSPVNTPSRTCGKWLRDCPPIRPGQITRLAIHAHGLSGTIFVAGRKNTASALTTKTLARHRGHLTALGRAMDKSATVLFVGCLAGQGPTGSELLKALSRIWSGRTVVAFTTIGFVSAGDMKRRGEACTEPGMRDTDNKHPASSWKQQQNDYGPLWKDLQKLPWASETSPHAKVAKNGTIVRGAST